MKSDTHLKTALLVRVQQLHITDEKADPSGNGLALAFANKGSVCTGKVSVDIDTAVQYYSVRRLDIRQHLALLMNLGILLE